MSAAITAAIARLLGKPQPSRRPPAGIIPNFLWKEQRIEALTAAIDRYTKANRNGPSVTEWMRERLELQRELLERQEAKNPRMINCVNRETGEITQVHFNP